jgi:hypothetical protein
MASCLPPCLMLVLLVLLGGLVSDALWMGLDARAGLIGLLCCVLGLVAVLSRRSQ